MASGPSAYEVGHDRMGGYAQMFAEPGSGQGLIMPVEDWFAQEWRLANERHGEPVTFDPTLKGGGKL